MLKVDCTKKISKYSSKFFYNDFYSFLYIFRVLMPQTKI